MAAKDRADALLRQAVSSDRPRPAAAATSDLDATTAAAPRRGFSAFDQDDLARASVLASRLKRRAQDAAESDLDGAVNLAGEALAGGADPELVVHALNLFAAHTPAGRELKLGRPVETAMAALVPTAAALVQVGGGSDGEEKVLDYWREDPLANEHHTHWHVVYPFIGLEKEDAPPELLAKIEEAGLGALSDDELKKVFRYQPRHGELFVYMHQQMLARYDAERLSVGLKPVEALRPKLPLTEIPEGYDPGAILSGPPFFFGPRKGGKTLDPDGAERLGKWRGAFDKAVDAKAYETPAGPAALDPTMSASISRPPCASSAAACRGAPTATCTTPATASSRTCPIRWTRRSRPAA
jgi:hypothetical protein